MLILALATLLVTLTESDAAKAHVAVATDGNATVAEQRVAITRAAAPTAWWQVRFRARRGSAALLVRLPSWSRLHFATETWFDALESTTAPRILPPANAGLDCVPSKSRPFHDTTSVWPAAAQPEELLSFTSPSDLLEWLSAEGLELHPSDRDLIDATGRNQQLAVLPYEFAEGDTSVVLRWALDDTEIAPLWPRSINTTLWVMDEALTRVTAAQHRQADALETVWTGATGRSDYLRRRQAAASSDDRWIIEAAGSGPLFSWSMLPGLVATVEPLEAVRARAKAEGADTSDFELALSAEGDVEQVTRLYGVPRQRVRLQQHDGQRQPVGFRADEFVQCAAAPAPSTSPGPISHAPDTPPTEPCSDCGPPPAPPVHQRTSCAGSTEPDARRDPGTNTSGSSNNTADSSDSGCSSDTSDSGDSGCSSDTSNSGDSGCSGDTSDSGDSGCSGDTSDSGDSGCSGDTSDDDDSGCSGDTSDDDDSGCSGDTSDAQLNWETDPWVQRAVRLRPRLGMLVFGFAGIALPARRRRKRS